MSGVERMSARQCPPATSHTDRTPSQGFRAAAHGLWFPKRPAEPRRKLMTPLPALHPSQSRAPADRQWHTRRSASLRSASQQGPLSRPFSMRPSGLEPPPGLRRTKPSIRSEGVSGVRGRKNRSLCGLCQTCREHLSQRLFSRCSHGIEAVTTKVPTKVPDCVLRCLWRALFSRMFSRTEVEPR